MPPAEPQAAPRRRHRFAILGSGRGSNAVALMRELADPEIPAELLVVVSNVPGAAILERAAQHGYPSLVVDSAGRDRRDHERELLQRLRERGVEHLLLAGYMRLLSADFIAAWPGAILNIHPSLLPDFPGLGAVAAQWRAEVRQSGATVHFVDAGIDTGPVLLRGTLEVRGDEGEAGLATRIREEVEHLLYPQALRLLLHRLDEDAQSQVDGAHPAGAAIASPGPGVARPRSSRPRVLVLGGGGREHAIMRALATSPEATLFCSPGNAGIADLATLLPLSGSQPASVVELARAHHIDLVIPGGETWICAGVADALAAAGIPCVGPRRAAGRIEASKAHMRALTTPLGVPGPRAVVVRSEAELAAALVTFPELPVLKADGLAAGKGVTVPEDEAALWAMARSLLAGSLGAAGRTLLLEERLHGREASLFFACAGRGAVSLSHARDYKRLRDGDRGPNTGGMGAVSPSPDLNDAQVEDIRQRIVLPTLRALDARGTPYAGFMYLGVLLADSGPALLEINVRLGDPEAQVLLPRLQPGTFLSLCQALAAGRLPGEVPRVSPAHACAVVLASAGYPGSTVPGQPIAVDDDALAASGGWLIHSGTAHSDGELRTAGGRVLSAVAVAETAARARRQAYAASDAVQFSGCQRREDIGED